jgi:hypothetical protein
MAKIRLELVPSKPLLLSHPALDVFSKTLERHEICILKKSIDKTLRLKFCFKMHEEELVQRLGILKQRANKAKMSDRSETQMTLRVIKDVMKSTKAEADVAGRSFLLTIDENQVTVETSRGRVTEMTLLYIQIYFRTIISYIYEAYEEMGEDVSLTEKYGDLLEKLLNHQNGDED